ARRHHRDDRARHAGGDEPRRARLRAGRRPGDRRRRAATNCRRPARGRGLSGAWRGTENDGGGTLTRHVASAPSPPRGERVGGRGPLRESLTFELAEAPLTPTLSPRRAGRGSAETI